MRCCLKVSAPVVSRAIVGGCGVWHPCTHAMWVVMIGSIVCDVVVVVARDAPVCVDADGHVARDAVVCVDADGHVVSEHAVRTQADAADAAGSSNHDDPEQPAVP